MKNATPSKEDVLLSQLKDDEKITKWKQELKDYFSTDNGYYIEKALIFLHQFQAGRLHQIKQIKNKDVKGLSPNEIAIVMQYLDNVFDTPVINKVVGEKNLTLENTPLLNIAITLLENLKSNHSKYLLLRDDIFIYNNAKLPVSAGTHRYSFLRAIYEYSNGESRKIGYKELADEVRKNKRYKNYSDKKITETLQKYITGKSDGEFRDKIINSVEANNKPLIETIKDFGIYFNNG